ncbi:hypothetical protein EYR38_001954 [Pleurotus pulmonarius]|nr:hypothetical protein EYR38_001954 [Pleurotus pulmonarius]
MPPLQPPYRNLPNEVLRMIFSTLTGTHPRRPDALYNLLFVSRRVNSIAKPLFYRHVALYCGAHVHLKYVDCQGYRQSLDSLVRAITADGAAMGACVRTLNLTIPPFAVEYGDEKYCGETLDALLPHLPHLRNLSAYYNGVEEPPVSKLALMPYPAKLTSLTINNVEDYPAFLAFLGACPCLEFLAVAMICHGADTDALGVIPPDVIPRLRGVYCDCQFLYFCLLAGRRIEHINLMGCDIPWAIHIGADLHALAGSMALARSLSAPGPMSIQCVLREDIIAPYSLLEFLAVDVCDKIALGDVQMVAECWSKNLRYIYLRCKGCMPGHDAIAEGFFAAMPSLIVLDIDIDTYHTSEAGSASPRCSRYLRGSPMEKDTALNLGFPCCDDFQDPMWVDSVEDLIERRLKDVAGEPPSQVL